MSDAGEGSLLQKGFPFPLPRLSTLSNPCCQFSRIIYQYKHIVIYK